MRKSISRGVHILIVLFGVTFLVALMLNFLPGDPAAIIAGENATPEQIEMVRGDLNLDKPLLVRYGLWLGNIFTGDFGVSYRTGQPVAEALLQRLPASIELMLLAQVFSLAIAVPLAVFSSYKPKSWLGRIVPPASVAAISVPEFVFALGLIFVGVLTLGWFPATGFVPISEGLGANLLTLTLPAIAISLDPIGSYTRLLRSDLDRTLKSDFMLAAKAKGMSVPNLLFKQALRPSTLSLATLVGLNTARLLGTVVVIETLFGIPGLGRLLVESLNSSDLITIQGVVVVIALAYIIVNIATDFIYAVIDPRVRHAK